MFQIIRPPLAAGRAEVQKMQTRLDIGPRLSIISMCWIGLRFSVTLPMSAAGGPRLIFARRDRMRGCKAASANR